MLRQTIFSTGLSTYMITFRLAKSLRLNEAELQVDSFFSKAVPRLANMQIGFRVPVKPEEFLAGGAVCGRSELRIGSNHRIRVV